MDVQNPYVVFRCLVLIYMQNSGYSSNLGTDTPAVMQNLLDPGTDIRAK